MVGTGHTDSSAFDVVLVPLDVTYKVVFVPTSPHIGPQLARLRRRRALTQDELAASAVVSVDVVRRLEQGKRTSARLSTLDSLARALGCTTADLLALDQKEGASGGGPRVEEIRHALTTPEVLGLIEPVEEEPVCLEELRGQMQRVWALYQDGCYAQVALRLPEVLAQARLLGRESVGDEQVEAEGLLATAYQAAAGVTITLGHPDLSFLAVERALNAARFSGSELHHASAVNFLSWVYRRSGRLSDAEHVATRAAEAIEPPWSGASSSHLAVFGSLLVNAAGAAARTKHVNRCRDLTSIARSAAERVGSDHVDRWAVFGPGVVAMTAVNDAVELDDLDTARRLIDQDPTGEGVPSSWRARYLLNVALTHTRHRNYQQAIEALAEAHRVASEWARYHPQSRVTAQILLERGYGRKAPNLVDIAQYDA